jgi:hypothetical protein
MYNHFNTHLQPNQPIAPEPPVDFEVIVEREINAAAPQASTSNRQRRSTVSQIYFKNIRLFLF